MEGWKRVTGGKVSFNLDQMLGTIQLAGPTILEPQKIVEAAKNANFTVKTIYVLGRGDLETVDGKKGKLTHRFVFHGTGQSFSVVGDLPGEKDRKSAVISGSFVGINEEQSSLQIHSIRKTEQKR